MSVKIVSPKHGRGEIWVDGKKVEGVYSVNVHLAAGEKTIVTLEVFADKCEIDLYDAKIEKKEREIR